MLLVMIFKASFSNWDHCAFIDSGFTFYGSPWNFFILILTLSVAGSEVFVCHMIIYVHVYCVLCRVYFQEELAAKEAKLSDQSHIDDDQRHYASCLELNEQFNKKSSALR